MAELIQIPISTRKTGLLVINDGKDEARLYYKNGVMIHAAANELKGMDALIEVIGFQKGDFEFRAGVTTSEINIDMDSNAAILNALKAFDERRKLDEDSGVYNLDFMELIKQRMKTLIRENPDFGYVAFFSSKTPVGKPVFEQKRKEYESLDFEGWVKFCQEMVNAYPRKSFTRVFCEDAEGILVIATMGNKYHFFVLADKAVTWGSLSMRLKKLTAELERILGNGGER